MTAGAEKRSGEGLSLCIELAWLATLSAMTDELRKTAHQIADAKAKNKEFREKTLRELENQLRIYCERKDGNR